VNLLHRAGRRDCLRLYNIKEEREGKRAERSIQKVCDELEELVERRTAELRETNESLQRDISECKYSLSDLLRATGETIEIGETREQDNGTRE